MWYGRADKRKQLSPNRQRFPLCYDDGPWSHPRPQGRVLVLRSHIPLECHMSLTKSVQRRKTRGSRASENDQFIRGVSGIH